MPANFESGVFTENKPAWHGLGVTVPEEALDSRQALELSGLSWEVTKRPIFIGNPDDGYTEVPNKFATVRDSDNSPLGVVGNRYNVFQNTAAFDFMDSLVGTGEAIYKTAGSLAGGAVVWLLVKLPKEFTIGGEVIEEYVLLANSHDGTTPIMAVTTPIRVVCQNTLKLALKDAKATIKIRHTQNAENKVAEARRVLGLAEGYTNFLRVEGERLLGQKMSRDAWGAFLNTLVPVPEEEGRSQTIANNVQDDINSVFFNAENLNDIRFTKWGALNAVMEYDDHVKARKGTSISSAAENKMKDIVFSDDNLTNKAYALLK